MYRSTLIAAVCLIFAADVSAQNSPTGFTGPVIVTQGFATLKLRADQAWVSLTVDARAGKAVEARSRAAMQMTAVQTAIRAVGLPADAVKTSSFSLEPQSEESYGARVRVREYAVKNEIEIRVDNLDLLGEVLDAATAAKTSDTLSVSVSGLRFTVKNNNTADQDVLTMAVQDAMARAEAIAKGAGRTLGEIVRIEEQSIADAGGKIQITTRSGTNSPQFNQAVRVTTPIEPNHIDFRSAVLLTVAIR